MTVDVSKIPAYVINLDRAPKRWQKWNQVDLGLDIRHFSAVDASKYDFINMTNFPTINNDYIISTRTKINILGDVRRSFEDINVPGALGCSLSHYLVWKKFLTDDSGDYLLVFEDDCNITSYDDGRLAKLIQKSFNDVNNYNFDVWLLGYNVIRDASRLEKDNTGNIPLASATTQHPLYIKNPRDAYVDVKSFYGTNAYMITREGVKKLMKNFFPIETHIDIYMGMKAQLGEISIIGSNKFHIAQESIFGDIRHQVFGLASLGRFDFLYKALFILIVIVLISLYIFYKTKKCKTGNFFHFVGDGFRCKDAM